MLHELFLLFCNCATKFLPKLRPLRLVPISLHSRRSQFGWSRLSIVGHLLRGQVWISACGEQLDWFDLTDVANLKSSVMDIMGVFFFPSR